MNVIDLEILIPASPEFIWRFMGDLAAIPQWYEDVVSVSFLSTQREGRGTRWRHATVKGGDVIVEVTAWYDTLGYEYRIVDGTTYSENQGRIRLHEVSDGTLVRWTFQYEAGGVLGGIRNAMRLKRSATNQIQDSLRNLHQLIMQQSGGISTHEARASMQDAPDVNERSSYQPRHPSAFHEIADDATDDDTSLSDRFPLAYDLEIEPQSVPPLVDSDTKPNPVVLGAGDELNLEAEPERKLDDTRPAEVEALLAEIPPPAIPAPEPVSKPTPPEQPALDPIEEPPPESVRSAPRDDSSHLSVFEIFGLQKPSEVKEQVDNVEKPLNEPASGSIDRDRKLSVADALEPVQQASEQEAENGLAFSSDRAASAGTTSGLRRSARRLKASIRSHR